MRVFVFGDSIAQGYFDTKSGGWASQLSMHYLREANSPEGSEWLSVFQLGVSGDTVNGVLDRIDHEVGARRLFEQEECIVLAIGINDSKLIENLPFSEEYDFQANYEKLIDRALKLCPRVICVGLSAVNEEVVNASGSESFLNNRINLFEDIIKQSSLRKEVAFVPIHDKFLRVCKETDLLADGLHPNTAGHKLIAKEVLAAIEALR